MKQEGVPHRGNIMRKGPKDQIVRFIIEIVRRQFGLGVESRKNRRKDQKNSLRTYHMKALNARGV